MTIVFLLVALVLGLFVVYPLVVALLTPTRTEWTRAVTTPQWRGTMLNTLMMAALSTTSSIIIGFLYAYATTKAMIPGRQFFKFIPILPLVTPPFVSGLSFILLFGRRGLITYELLGLNTSIYGWHGLWLAQTISFFPIAFLAISGVLRSINPNLERAAQSLGARGLQIARGVTLPLASPGIAAAALLVAIAVLGDFGNPMLIAGRFRVLATEAYLQISGWADMRMGAVLGIILLIPAVIFFALQQKLLGGKSMRFATVGGRGSRMEEVPTPAWLRWTLFGFCSFITVFMLFKYGVILLGAITNLWAIDYSFTLSHFEYILFRTRELWNSLRFASIAAVLCAILSTLAAYLVHRQKLPFGKVLDVTTLLPAAIPGTLLGISYILAFNTPPFELTGTGLIIILSMVFAYLPVGYRLSVSTLQQIQPSVEESANDLGASGMRTFIDVVLPLIRASFTASLVYCFVKAISTLSAVVFLISHGTVVASASILNLAEEGYWGRAAAMSAALITIALVTLGLFKLLLGRKFKLFEL